MNYERIKRTVAISITTFSIVAVIFASNRKSGAITIGELHDAVFEKPRISLAKTSMRTAEAFKDTVYESQAEELTLMDNSASTSNPNLIEKKKIKNADVNLQVENLADTMNAIEEWVRNFNGYISNSNENSNSMNINAHIPSESFEKAMESCGSLGKITNRSINERDITDQYYDLKTRIENKRILINKFQDYLKKANNVKEILQVESQLANTTAELENLQGQMNRMSKEISFSQVHFYAQLPASRNENGIILPDTKSEFSEFISNIVIFGLHYVWAILYIAICGTLIILLIFLMYWICFGRIGLLRRLFDKIK